MFVFIVKIDFENNVNVWCGCGHPID